MNRFNQIQNVLFISGIALLCISVALGLADLAGWFELPQVIQNIDSSVKMYARGAVLGCVIAAAGSWHTSPINRSSQSHPVKNHKE